MAGKMMNLIIFAFLPITFSMKMKHVGNFPSDAHIMALSAVKANASTDNPHKMALSVVVANATAIAELATVFDRSAAVHRKSMDEISKLMTQPKALEVLKKIPTIVNASTVNQFKGLLTSSQNLRKQVSEQDGFGGLDGARKLLNGMIHEVMLKYDQEIAKCTDYYAKQCALMEAARGQISAANYVAATARALILDSQASINHCELSIPENKKELTDHNRKCKGELGKMNANLKIIMDDIAIMTMILEMSDCDSKKLLQTKKLTMLKCEDKCTKKEYVTFNHKSLQDHVDELKSPGMRELMADTFADLFDDGEEEETVQLVQVPGSEYMEAVVDETDLLQAAQDPNDKAPAPKKAPRKKTEFNNPPLPKTKVPSNPCTDKNQGAPSAANKRAAKCTLKKSPRCYKLQARFLQIQAEIMDSRDALMELISTTEASCEETKTSLESSIAADTTSLSSSQTKLAMATEKESGAAEYGRQIGLEVDQYNADLMKQMKTCNDNYVNYETDLCALKKIRGDVFKKMKPGHTGFFQDCELAPWTPEACSAKCAGGTMKLTRSVAAHPNGGSKCLPLSAKKRCNLSPCPVDCVLHQWSGWSKCSSKCGGGLSQRVRDVMIPTQYAGKQCGQTGQTKQCNVDACEKDCVLQPWTRWSACSKDCDGGSRKRERMIREPVEGGGKCASKWLPERLQYQPCAMHRCKVTDPLKVKKCNQHLDVVLVVDGTPKNGQRGFDAEIAAVNLFVDAFEGKDSKGQPSHSNFAIVHYTGPRTWSGVSKCTGKTSKKVDMEKTCKVTLAQHFTNDLATTRGTVNSLTYQPGSKLLSLALMTTQFEFTLGDKDARTVVVVFMDGQPLSYRKTNLASRAIRKKARLLYVIVAKFAPLKHIKTWVSRRWQENLIQVKSVEQLATAEVGTHLVANICPSTFPKMKAPKKKKL